MQQQDPNQGRSEESRFTHVPVGGTMSTQDEQTWSMVAHLSVLLNLITGIGGPIAALVIWLVYKDKSQRVAFHALQALWYQVAWAVILMVGWAVTTILMVVVIGFLLVPVMLIASLVPFVHMCYAAYKVNQGVNYRYPFIADQIDPGRRFA
jgi:uncharacterized Tic20 family protein